jgi:hypothetical protein
MLDFGADFSAPFFFLTKGSVYYDDFFLYLNNAIDTQHSLPIIDWRHAYLESRSRTFFPWSHPYSLVWNAVFIGLPFQFLRHGLGISP